MNLDPLRDWLLEDPATRVPLTLSALGVLLVLPLVGFAVYLWRMAGRGDALKLPARTIRAFAIFFVVAAVALVFMLWRFAMLLRVT